jgi:hypothetical protein
MPIFTNRSRAVSQARSKLLEPVSRGPIWLHITSSGSMTLLSVLPSSIMRSTSAVFSSAREKGRTSKSTRRVAMRQRMKAPWSRMTAILHSPGDGHTNTLARRQPEGRWALRLSLLLTCLGGCAPSISPERYESWCRQLDEVRVSADASRDRAAAEAPSTLREDELLRWDALMKTLVLAQCAGALAYLRNDARDLDDVQAKVNDVLVLFPPLPLIVKEHEGPYVVDPGAGHEGYSELPR